MRFDWMSSLIALVVFILFLILYFWKKRAGQSRAAIQFSNTAHLQAAGKSWRVRYQWFPDFLTILAVLSLLIAFARPQQGLEAVKTAREGIAIQMVMDRSSSMNEPLSYRGKELNRLDVVKAVFEAFVLGNQGDLSGRSNDMIGLTSFAGFVEENSPITLDHETLVNFARTIQTASRVEDGTMIGDAIYYATLRLISVDELLKKAGQKNNEYKVNSKIIILLTDGQQTRGGIPPQEAAELAKDNQIKIYTVAIVNEGKYQRKDSVFGQFFSLMDRELDTTLLENIAEITGGSFAKASSGEDLVEIYRQINQLEKTAFEERFTTYKERYPIFVLIGLGLLLLEIVLSQTVFRRIP